MVPFISDMTSNGVSAGPTGQSTGGLPIAVEVSGPK